ncbi:uncharacterized protein LOC130784594 isoform X4 [Actinidia eriantha]|uniref:uncharacterized protein LOC130784594 isoform X4 n=1 Tax=Actinidia eriantha TaxID=165200 RepID=UPI0025889B99|nr:uncharacterized protein LOC130784594 isoform X4 [Actinidia eriantha]XP_057500498.1 uncharacterized protein LOC130784594 isoform X4 [Actinidia eriantha]XP_057500499.1 uncharacterized protein LOC130784594 isoform X4 [Actinidia eriantha]
MFLIDGLINVGHCLLQIFVTLEPNRAKIIFAVLPFSPVSFYEFSNSNVQDSKRTNWMLACLCCCCISRFPLFVITPDWLADVLHDSIVGGIFCLIFGLLLVVVEIQRIREYANWECNTLNCGYCLGTLLLFFFTIRHLCLGPW